MKADKTVCRSEDGPMTTETPTSLRTLDGLHLAGTLVTPDQPTERAAVLVQGGGVTRDEGGFFTRMAADWPVLG